MKPLCIYHGNCADGFAAAWVVRKFFGENSVDFHAGVYQDAPPDVTGRDVIMVDFSYKRAVIEEMMKSARSILILDHHRSAMRSVGQCTKCGAPDGRMHGENCPEAGLFRMFTGGGAHCALRSGLNYIVGYLEEAPKLTARERRVIEFARAALAAAEHEAR